MSISEVQPENDQAVVPETSSGEEVKAITGNTSKYQRRVLTQRAQKRALRWERNHEIAEEHCKMGDAFLAKGEYAGACARYIDATVLWASNPVYYSKLSETYNKCGLFAEAAHAATRSLSLNPQHTAARYERGVARAAQGLLRAAQIDFELIISQDSAHALAEAALSKVTHELSPSQASLPIPSASPTTTCTPYNTPATATLPPYHHAIQFPIQLPTPTQIPTPSPESVQELPPPVDFAFPSLSPSTPPLYEPSLSDSSDCFHVGNGIPCRFYNTHPLGCGMGLLCRFAHSPDEKSVRDNLGKNVCTYHILSLCKFGPEKCVYSHVTQFLPMNPGAWWSTPEGIQKVRKVVELAEARKRSGKSGKKVEPKAVPGSGKPADEADKGELGAKDGDKKKEFDSNEKSGKSLTPKSGQSWRSAKTSPTAMKSSKLTTPISARQSLQKKPPTPGQKDITQAVLVARYLRWTVRGIENLERMETAKIITT